MQKMDLHVASIPRMTNILHKLMSQILAIASLAKHPLPTLEEEETRKGAALQTTCLVLTRRMDAVTASVVLWVEVVLASLDVLLAVRSRRFG